MTRTKKMNRLDRLDKLERNLMNVNPSKTFILGTILIILVAITFPLVFNIYGKNFHSFLAIVCLLCMGGLGQAAALVEARKQEKSFTKQWLHAKDILDRFPMNW